MKVMSLSDNPLEHKIMTKKRFSAAVEHLVANNNMSYIDAASYVIETRAMDYKNLKKLLTPSLKQKIEEEASSLHLIKTKRGNKLPVRKKIRYQILYKLKHLKEQKILHLLMPALLMIGKTYIKIQNNGKTVQMVG